jgi:hypothetical protein
LALQGAWRGGGSVAETLWEQRDEILNTVIVLSGGESEAGRGKEGGSDLDKGREFSQGQSIRIRDGILRQQSQDREEEEGTGKLLGRTPYRPFPPRDLGGSVRERRGRSKRVRGRRDQTLILFSITSSFVGICDVLYAA